MKNLFPPISKHRLRAVLRACKQTTDVEKYVSHVRKIIPQVRNMSALDKVDHFSTGTDGHFLLDRPWSSVAAKVCVFTAVNLIIALLNVQKSVRETTALNGCRRSVR